MKKASETNENRSGKRKEVGRGNPTEIGAGECKQTGTKGKDCETNKKRKKDKTQKSREITGTNTGKRKGSEAERHTGNTTKRKKEGNKKKQVTTVIPKEIQNQRNK